MTEREPNAAQRRGLSQVRSHVPAPARRSLRKVRAAVVAGRQAARDVSNVHQKPPPKTHRRLAMVDVIDRWHIDGWVVDEAANLPVRVTLHVGNLQVASTWASGPCAHNTYTTARAFHFEVRDIWDYCKKKDRVTVRIDNVPLPIAKTGAFKRPDHNGEHSLDDLRVKFENGYVFGQGGWLQLSKKLDTTWQAAVSGLYTQVSEVVKREFGYDPFVIYGTQLGLAREGGFIGHDVDFDAAYLSEHTDPERAAAELRDVGLRLVDAGFDIECKRTALHVHDLQDPDVRIDLFHVYFDANGELQLPFGVAGKTHITKAEWGGITDAQLAGITVRAPADGQRFAEMVYGESWQVPVPGFDWDRDRTRWARAAWTKDEYREEVYWANFYARHELTSGSSFFEFVDARDDTVATVLDIGCGDGRDAFAFARAGRRARGIDRSHVGIRHATKKATDAGLEQRLSFAAVDVGDAPAVHDMVKQLRESADGGPILFYLRFFLHSIPEDVQETLMRALAEAAQDGDMLAAEFRTAADESTKKVYEQHYRRYQDGFAFGRALRERYGFGDVRFEHEGTGLATYKDEDPVVYRVVAACGTGRPA